MKTLDKIEQYLILKENWVEAEKRWVGDGLDKNEFDDSKIKFITYSKKNLIPPGKERDIAYWMKKPYSEFKEFLKKPEEKAKEREQEKGKKTEVLTVFENDKVKVIIPRTKEASCEYGQNTKWCTAGKIDNMFAEYLYGKGTTLYYLIVKGSPMDERLMYDKDYVRKFKTPEDEKAFFNISPEKYNKIAIAFIRKDKLLTLQSGKMQAQMQVFDALDNLMKKDWLRKFCEIYNVPFESIIERTEKNGEGYKLKE